MSSVNNNFEGANGQPAQPSPEKSRALSGDELELQLQRYVDGRLEGAERAAVEETLKRDAGARRMMDALREEEQLLRTALEPRVEPSKRIVDKVLLTLHNEERFRLNALRNKRLRRQVVGVMTAAATVLLCLWLVKPRDAAGTAVSGTVATLTTPSGEVRTVNKDTPIYEGDIIKTMQAQFLRVRLADGGTLDIDEHTRVEIERGSGVTLRLMNGRAGVDATTSRQDVIVHLPQGMVRVTAGTLVDLWLPVPSAVVWPSLLETLPGSDLRTEPTLASPAVVTVLKGSAYLVTERYPEGISLGSGQRSLFTAQARVVRKIDVSASRVLEARRDNGWHISDGMGPRDHVVIGLLNKPEFSEYGRRLKLTQKNLSGMAESLAALDQAMTERNPQVRAQKLAAGQQALRAAYEPLDREEESHHFGRMLEGLSHLERGRALLELETPENIAAANTAFAAALVALDDAQQPVQIPGQPLPPKSLKAAWPAALNAGASTLGIADLSPADQSALLAAFYYPVTEYLQARTESAAGRTEKAAAAARDFQALRTDRDDPSHDRLGRSVENLATMLGEAFALDLAGQREKSIDVLQDLVSVPLAGISETSRPRADGIKQSALLALVRMYVAAKDMKNALATADDFWLLYPLDGNSAAARDINRALAGELLVKAEAALKASDFRAAVDLFDELLNESTQDGIRTSIELRLKLVRALIGLGSGDRARQELSDVASKIPADRRAEFETLQNDAKALPSTPGTRKDVGLPALPK